ILITGMSQLQQVLLRQKGGETLDLEPKAVSELAKLPEYTPESGATDFQDYLYLAEQQIGSLASGAGEWWQKTLAVAQKAYAEYQSLSPMKRLSVKAVLTEELREEKYKKLERKDRAQLLRQLDVSESSAGPAEAVVSIRRWYRLLQRAADLNIALPDESLQVRSLCNIVKKTSEQNADFKFRVALAKTELQIDSRPSQANVMRFLQHLLAELEQLGAGSRKASSLATPASTATAAGPTSTTTTSLKAVQPTADSPKGKGKAAVVSPGQKKPCQWFGTDNGCRNGKQCTFVHAWTGLNRSERCLLCGSKQHRAKECPTKDNGPSERPPPPPPKATTAAMTASTTTAAAIAPSPAKASTMAPEASTSAPSTATGTNKIDAAKVTEILNETNKMLKAFQAQSGPETAAPQPPADPLAMIQQQLDEVRRLKTITVKDGVVPSASSGVAFSSAVEWYETRLSSTTVGLNVTGSEEEEALLDSGASHAYRAAGQRDGEDNTRTVAVTLATGEERHLRQTRGGTLLGDNTSEAIVPMGQLVSLLGCKVSWTPSRLIVIHPLHGRLRVRLRGQCPVVPISQAMTLIAELEEARIKEFKKTVEDLQTQVKVIRDQGREGWSCDRHLQSLLEDGDRTSMAGFLHTSPVFAALPPEVLLGLPESVPREAKDGWKLLKGMPWSRAKRRSLFQSDGWVVHLCSGDERTRDAKQQQTMRRAFWSNSLVGGDVIVDVDITASKDMDLLRQDAVFKVLAWAALAGKIKEGTVSLFDHPMWKSFAQEDLMGEVPCVLNGKRVRLGGNLDLWHLRNAELGALEAGDPAASVWPMEFVAHVAEALQSWKGLRNREGLLASLVRQIEATPSSSTPSLAKFDVKEWKLHLQRDHLPYRRDCRVCIERASGKPHRRVSHPSAYSLAVDLAGPFRKDGAGGYKYLMVGCYRFPKLEGVKAEKGMDEAKSLGPTPDDGEDWILDEEEHAGEEKRKEHEFDDKGDDKVAETIEDVACDETPLDKEVEALKELASPLEFTSVYLARPMKSRKKKDALRAVQELYVQLRSNGFPVCKLHSDRARELQTDALESWAAARDIEVTRTQGSDPAGNGTAERAVGAIKARIRVLLGQAKELSGAEDDVVRTWWPFAAETAVAQHQAVAFGRKLPTVARFGSKVFTKRKGYGQGGRFDLQPRWMSATYLGPARSVPGGHLVLTDEGNLWYTTNVRQFEEPPKEDEGAAADTEAPVPPARRIRRKSSVVELAGGVGLMPGLWDAKEDGTEGAHALRALAALAGDHVCPSSDEVLSEDAVLKGLEFSSEASTKSNGVGPRGDLAAEYLGEGRFSMNDCLEVLQNENFRRTKKQRASAWKDNAPPPIHTTLGAYQRGPSSGVTTATARHNSLTAYLVAMFKHHSGEDVSFTSMTVARDLCTDAHKDRFNLKTSKNYVLTVGNFVGGGIWKALVQGELEVVPALLDGPGWFPQPCDESEEMWVRMWTRRLLDEEENLISTIPQEENENFTGVLETNKIVAKDLDDREADLCQDRYEVEQWLSLCRLAEGEDEVRGVEPLLETLPNPLKVVFTVALDEVKQYISRWVEAIHKETDALIKAKALIPLTIEEQQELEASGRLVILPAKGVFTVKPPDQEVFKDESGQDLPPGSPEFFKRKARLVICGNFQGKQAREDSYAGGCQTDALRIMLVHTAAFGWLVASTDIRNAFILAPIKEDEDDDDTTYALYPPKVFQLAKVEYSLRLWRVDRALYGFRRSPRLWGKFRDRRLRAAKILYKGGYIYLRQHKADENIWSAVVVAADGQEETQAYVNVYVDDILYVGLQSVIVAIHSWLTEEWKASPLTWASATSPLRFLGLEIVREDSGVIRLHQRGYIEELLRHHGLTEARGYTIPCPQEWLLGENETTEEQYDEPQLRRAQALTGELLWLSGKSRPDLLHTVATMSSWCLKCPSLVEKIGLRALGYLKETIDVELYYNPKRLDHYVEGFSDASFAPHGSRSVGCCLTRYLQQPVAWRCGRQALVALSVAEAELIEAISAAQMSYGVIAVTSELQTAVPTLTLKVDNAAAVGLSNESAGTWKTRHLRVRAYHLREAVRLKEITIEHIPGAEQLGDLGTKAFHRPRLQELLRLWGLLAPETRGEPGPSSSSSSLAKVNGTVAVLARLAVVLGWLIQVSRASPVEGHNGLQVSFPWELYGLAVVALIAAIGIWEAMKWCLEWCSLKYSGSVQDARQARRLRRLQQAVSEEVARYGLDDLGVDPSTPRTLTRSTRRPSPFRSAPEPQAVATATVAVQTDFDDGYRPFNGPFVVSEHGDRVHYEPTCHGLRNATS
ncbi:GIP, partial [Symbiodinium microadriaticum]